MGKSFRILMHHRQYSILRLFSCNLIMATSCTLIPNSVLFFRLNIFSPGAFMDSNHKNLQLSFWKAKQIRLRQTPHFHHPSRFALCLFHSKFISLKHKWWELHPVSRYYKWGHFLKVTFAVSTLTQWCHIMPYDEAHHGVPNPSQPLPAAKGLPQYSSQCK